MWLKHFFSPVSQLLPVEVYEVKLWTDTVFILSRTPTAFWAALNTPLISHTINHPHSHHREQIQFPNQGRGAQQTAATVSCFTCIATKTRQLI